MKFDPTDFRLVESLLVTGRVVSEIVTGNS